MRRTTLPLLLAAALVAGPAYPAPPPGANPDSPLADWFRSLRDRKGLSCCDQADCRPVRYRAGDQGMEAYIDRRSFGPRAPEAWVRVPREAIIPRENPTARPIACYYAGRIACFVRPTEG